MTRRRSISSASGCSATSSSQPWKRGWLPSLWKTPKPRLLGDKLLKGHVLHIDRFGNVITNISREQFEECTKNKPKARPKIILATKDISEMVQTYGEGKSPLFFLFGSTGFLEIASRERSAAVLLNIAVGKDVGLMFE